MDNPNTYDATARLVEKAKAGDKTAMKTLILAYRPLVYKTAGPFPDFEDAVSDFNLDLIKAVRAFDAEKGVYFPVYLKGVMMKQAKKRWRSRGPEPEYFDTTEEIHPGTANIEEDVTFRQDLREAHDAIEKLPFRQKCVIRAYYLYGIPIKTIAKRHGCSEHAMENARYYGVESLKKDLKLK